MKKDKDDLEWESFEDMMKRTQAKKKKLKEDSDSIRIKHAILDCFFEMEYCTKVIYGGATKEEVKSAKERLNNAKDLLSKILDETIIMRND